MDGSNMERLNTLQQPAIQLKQIRKRIQHYQHKKEREYWSTCCKRIASWEQVGNCSIPIPTINRHYEAYRYLVQTKTWLHLNNISWLRTISSKNKTNQQARWLTNHVWVCRVTAANKREILMVETATTSLKIFTTCIIVLETKIM